MVALATSLHYFCTEEKSKRSVGRDWGLSRLYEWLDKLIYIFFRQLSVCTSFSIFIFLNTVNVIELSRSFIHAEAMFFVPAFIRQSNINARACRRLE